MRICLSQKNMLLQYAIFYWLFIIIVFLDTSVCTGCCSSLDHILTFLFKKLNKQKTGGGGGGGAFAPSYALLQLPQARPEILQVIILYWYTELSYNHS